MFCVDTVLMCMCTRRLGSGPPYHEGGSVWHWGALRGRALLFCVGWPAFLAAGVLYIHVYIYVFVYLLYILYII